MYAVRDFPLPCLIITGEYFQYVPGSKHRLFSYVERMVINPLIGIYIAITRIPIMGWMTINLIPCLILARAHLKDIDGLKPATSETWHGNPQGIRMIQHIIEDWSGIHYVELRIFRGHNP